MAVLHRAHTSGFCSALEQLPHSVALLLSLSPAASSVRGISSDNLKKVDFFYCIECRKMLFARLVATLLGRRSPPNKVSRFPQGGVP